MNQEAYQLTTKQIWLNILLQRRLLFSQLCFNCISWYSNLLVTSFLAKLFFS